MTASALSGVRAGHPAGDDETMISNDQKMVSRSRHARQQARTALQQERLALAVWGILAAVIIWLLASWAAQPTPLPSDTPIPVPSDTTLTTTQDNSPQNIMLAILCAPGAPVTITYVTPFAPTPTPGATLASTSQAPSSTQCPKDGSFPVSLRIAPADAKTLPIGDHTALVAMVGDSPRQVTVRVTASAQAPALAILGGLLLAYAAIWWVASKRPADMLVRKAYLLYDQFCDLESDNINKTDGTPRYSMRRYATATLGCGVNANQRVIDSVVALASTGEIAAAQERLEALERVIPKFWAFLDQVNDLRRVYAPSGKLSSPFPEASRKISPPAILQELDLLINPKSVSKESVSIKDEAHLDDSIQEAARIAAVYPAAVEAYGEWQEAYALLQARVDSAALEAPEEAKQFAEAQYELAHARVHLYREDLTLDDVKAIEERIESAARALVQIPIVPRKLTPTGERAVVQDIRVSVEPLSQKHAEDIARMIGQRVQFVDAFFLMIGLFAAVVTGLGVLYVGKPFGTPLDYLTAVLWGIGVDASLVGLSAVLAKLGISLPLGAPTKIG